LRAAVFDWAPETKALFFRAEYIRYLGAMELNVWAVTVTHGG